ncbi:hypothetical protein R3P38DRAFT_3451885 [Favolaschia claudopus]|uniref:Uncharacterized protein n=1 Tax=Favolaschia claudopus TaxID=2862362 RepID=A0AAV9ZL62_9AGAR
MSVSINGCSPTVLAFTAEPKTTLSRAFAHQLYPSGRLPSWLPISLNTRQHGSFTVLLQPVVGTSQCALSLGLDWKAFMRELLLSSGWSLNSDFDPVSYFLPARMFFLARAFLSSADTGAFLVVTVSSGAGGRLSVRPDAYRQEALPPGSHISRVASSSAGGAVNSPSAGGASSAGGAVNSPSAGGAFSAGGAVNSPSAGGALMFNAVEFPSAGGALSSSSAGGAVDLPSAGGALSSSAGGAVASSSRVRVVGAPSARLNGCNLLRATIVGGDVAYNVFLNSDTTFFDRMSDAHGIVSNLFQSVEQYRAAILSHLMLGMCSGRAMSCHAGCAAVAADFATPLEQAYFAISSLLSTPDITFSQLRLCAGSVGFDAARGSGASVDQSLEAVRSYLSEKRRALVSDYAGLHPAHVFFHDVEYMSTSTLASVASLHRLSFHNATSDGLRNSLISHMASGQCAIQAEPQHPLGCASVVDQLFPAGPPSSMAADDLKGAMEIQLLTYLLPRMSKKLCRRVLTVRGVEWTSSQGIASLRSTSERRRPIN